MSPWTLLRRFVTMAALAFSLGGFSFYAAVVVPTGTQVLDATSQGFVTQQVTRNAQTADIARRIADMVVDKHLPAAAA